MTITNKINTPPTATWTSDGTWYPATGQVIFSNEQRPETTDGWGILGIVIYPLDNTPDCVVPGSWPDNTKFNWVVKFPDPNGSHGNDSGALHTDSPTAILLAVVTPPGGGAVSQSKDVNIQ